MEVGLYEGTDFPFTTDWYREREHAPHAEQGVHRPRMDAVCAFCMDYVTRFGARSIVDLGAGDGGMLSMIEARFARRPGIPQLWGYDLMPTNVAFAQEHRQQAVTYVDFIDEPIVWGDLAVITECLEHLKDPHVMVRRIYENAQGVVASSPASETAESHDECHAWVWDMEGYRAMFEGAGFRVVAHEFIRGGYDFQVLMGVSE
jgi:hypothetical protein